MIGFGHTSTGVLIGIGAIQFLPEKISTPTQIFIVFLLGVISHYITDFIPHGHYAIDPEKLTKKSLALFTLDTLGVAMFFLLIALYKYGLTSSFWLIAFAITGAQLPDVWQGINKLTRIKQNTITSFESYLHSKIAHWHNPPNTPIPGGGRPWSQADIWQISIFMFALWSVLFIG